MKTLLCGAAALALLTLPAAAQDNVRSDQTIQPNELTQQAKRPQLKLDDTQSAAIRDAIVAEHTQQKTPDGFKPEVGAALPKTMKVDALPLGLVRSQPALKQYGHAKTATDDPRAVGRAPDLGYLADVARAADRLGFASVLTPTGTWCEDAWITTAALAPLTRRLKFIVAFRPDTVSPTAAAQMAASFQRVSGGRLLLNVVTGGDDEEQRRYGDWLDHDRRYARTDEFLSILRGAWSGTPYDFEGEHYRVAAMEPCLVPPNVDEMLREGAFLHFMSTVQACMDAGIFPAGDALPITLDLWTAAHGVAALLIAKPYLPWGEVDEIADRALRAAALGHAVDGLLGGDGSIESIVGWITAQRRKRSATRKSSIT